jgi:hypothetical protein
VQQHMAAAKQAHQQEINNLGLPDDHTGDFLPDPLPGLDEPANGRNILVHWLAVGIDGRGACGPGFDSWHNRFLKSKF